MKRWWTRIGPGMITGVAGDDPAGIATYAQIGARFGLGLAWLVPWSFPMVVAVQELAARLSLVTGKGIVAILREKLPKSVVVLVVIIVSLANIFNISANLFAMVESVQLITGGNSTMLIGAILVALMIWMTVWLPYRQTVKLLRVLCVSLLVYPVTAWLAMPEGARFGFAILEPIFSFTKESFIAVIAFFGTTISPYLFLWQSDEEVEDEKESGHKTLAQRKGANAREVRLMRGDTVLGMGFSQLMALAILVTAAGAFHQNGIFEIESSTQAAAGLAVYVNSAARILFATGIIGTGLLAIPVLASVTGYAFADAFGWKSGLGQSPGKAMKFYGVIALSLFIGWTLHGFGMKPMQALYASAVLNGIVAGPFILLMIWLGNDRRRMGVWKSRWYSNFGAGLSAMLLIFGTIALCF